MKRAVITALEMTNKEVEKGNRDVRQEYARTGIDPVQSDDEIRSECYAHLIRVVASLKDEQALRALMGAIDTGTMATDALVEFGSTVLDPVIGTLNNEALPGLVWVNFMGFTPSDAKIDAFHARAIGMTPVMTVGDAWATASSRGPYRHRASIPGLAAACCQDVTRFHRAFTVDKWLKTTHTKPGRPKELIQGT